MRYFCYLTVRSGAFQSRRQAGILSGRKNLRKSRRRNHKLRRTVSHSNRSLDEILRRIERANLKVDRREKSAKHMDHLLRHIRGSPLPTQSIESSIPPFYTPLPSPPLFRCYSSLFSFCAMIIICRSRKWIIRPVIKQSWIKMYACAFSPL